MILDKDYSEIRVVEEVIEHRELTAILPRQETRYWVARLAGLPIDDNPVTVEIQRNGATPDEALKNLFEAMSDAGVTL